MTHTPLAYRALRLLVLLLCWVLVLPEHLYLPWSGLPVDPHWQLVLHHALSQGWLFGRDIVFTYGPLGFLEERAPVAGFKDAYLAADLVSYTLLLAIGISALRRLRGAGSLLLLVLASFAFGAYRSPPSLALLLLGFFLFAVFLYLESGQARYLLGAAAVAVVGFHVKANTGIAMSVLFVAVLGVEGVARPEARRALLGAAAVFSGLLGISFLVLPVAPLGYLRGIVHYVRAYPDAMGLATPGSAPWAALAVGELALAAALVIAHARDLRRERPQALAAALVGCSLFLLLRQGFVRADWVPRHIPAFFQFSLLVVGLWYLFASAPLRRHVGILFVIVLGCALVRPLERGPGELLDKARGVARYIHSARTPGIPPELALPKLPEIPERFRARIGDAPMDIMAYESALPILEGLNYRPRPVFQSYAALDPYLDQLNADALADPDGARFIVFAGTAIDGRYAFFDETRTKLTLLKHFRVADAGGGRTLLERSGTPRRILRHDVHAGRARLGDALPIPSRDGLIELKADLDYSLEGRLISLLFRPPPLSITLVRAHGRSLRYRLPRAAIADGILVTPYVGSQTQVALFFQDRFGELDPVRSVTIRSPQSWGFHGWFSYRLTQLVVEPPTPDSAPPGPAGPRSERSTPAKGTARASAPAPRADAAAAGE